MNPLTHTSVVIQRDRAQRHLDAAQAQRASRKRTKVRAGVAVLGVFIGFAAADQAQAARAETMLVSQSPNAAVDDFSSEAAVSADGRFVAFTSAATNLSDGDGDGVRDVFVRDTHEETVVLVSRAAGPDGAGGQYESFAPSISANGRYVAFASYENGFSDEDADGLDVFVRDLKRNTIELVSRASGRSGAGGDSNSHAPSISANGRFVAFESNADNLDNASADVGNVFVRDLKEDKTFFVSRRSGTNGKAATKSSGDPSISADGSRVAFESYAANLSSDDGEYYDVFVRDLKSSKTLLVSRTSGGGAGGNYDSADPAISQNGKAVAFRSGSTNFDPADEAHYDIYLRNLASKETIFVSRRSGKNGLGASDASTAPSISGGGRYVAFESDADNLSRDDGDAYRNIFVRDLATARTVLASRASGTKGLGADGDSTQAAISADGKYVAYGSEADNLSEADSAGIPEIFQRDLRLRKGVG